MSPPIHPEQHGREVTNADLMVELKLQNKDLAHIKARADRLCKTLHGERPDGRDGMTFKVNKLVDAHRFWTKIGMAALLAFAGAAGAAAWKVWAAHAQPEPPKPVYIHRDK